MGSFGCVFKCKKKDSGNYYVIKEIDMKKLPHSLKKDAVREAQIMQKIVHSYIVDYKEAKMDREQQALYIVLEYCEHGDLSHFLKKHKGVLIPEDKVWRIFI